MMKYQNANCRKPANFLEQRMNKFDIYLKNYVFQMYVTVSRYSNNKLNTRKLNSLIR